MIQTAESENHLAVDRAALALLVTDVHRGPELFGQAVLQFDDHRRTGFGRAAPPRVADHSLAEPHCFLEVEEGSGSFSTGEFDDAVYDLVNFLYYVGEPTRLERERLGVYVLLFLGLLFVFAYLLNREYWKDVH